MSFPNLKQKSSPPEYLSSYEPFTISEIDAPWITSSIAKEGWGIQRVFWLLMIINQDIFPQFCCSFLLPFLSFILFMGSFVGLQYQSRMLFFLKDILFCTPLNFSLASVCNTLNIRSLAFVFFVFHAFKSWRQKSTNKKLFCFFQHDSIKTSSTPRKIT